ncbi:hypothetical protein HMPREF9141_2069 [Prevotella multiformis DSM 16608]|uniref:Uncharacterized protein n=1 Tax=Prevotella multiformis DSM 16608 TaxID=888743 RepID=F0F902_9BACT|nr:hypothetical protein HMPREF9141_2069 [Prevotella multiformis DSM 16608]
MSGIGKPAEEQMRFRLTVIHRTRKQDRLMRSMFMGQQYHRGCLRSP